jgi:hypothetical protein
MATAEKRPVPTPAFNVVLTMSQDEANTLTTILGFVGGSTEHSPRKHAEAISEALRLATGLTHDQTHEYDLLDEKRGLSFRDY